jgi:type II secretory pathway pseudopilin PulG
MDRKHRSDGFLLIELLIVIALSVFLFGLTAYWQGLIIQTRHEALNRLKIITTVRNLIEEMQRDYDLISKGSRQENEVLIKWQITQLVTKELSLPFILKQSPSFKLIDIEVLSRSYDGNSHTMHFVTGITNAET